MPRTEVGTEVVFHRLVGVRDGHVAQRTVARTFGGPHQQFEVHHVVDDDRILPFVLVVVPRADQPHFGLEARRQRARPGEQHLLVGLVSREAQPVAETAIEHEPHVVVVGGVFLPLDARGVHPSVFQHPGIAAVLVDVPQHAREKAAAPPARIRRDVPAVLPRARQAAFARAVFFRPSAASAARRRPAPRPRRSPAVFARRRRSLRAGGPGPCMSVVSSCRF